MRATPSARAVAQAGEEVPSSWTSCATLRAIGIIISVVAVLEIHIDNRAEATMKPPTRPTGLLPKVRTTLSAMREWRFHFSMARATMNPPSKSMTMGLA